MKRQSTLASAITVYDDDGGTATASTSSYVVVYDPDGGHVTGAADFVSPSGALTPNDPTDSVIVGPVHVGFNVQYQTGDTVPSGMTDFRFRAADLEFRASGFTWLVVTDGKTKAYFRGVGDVNGVSGYDFLVSVIDGQPDYIRIQVSNHATGDVLYDNQAGAPDDASAVQPVDQAEIQIH